MTKEELSLCIDSCGDDVYGFCLFLTASRAAADDLYQDTFLTALEKVDRISSDGNPGSYLMGVALRLWKNQRRKEVRRMRIAGEESLEERWERTEIPEIRIDSSMTISPENMVLERNLKSKLKELVLQLKPEYRIPVSLYYAGERSVKEIAEIMSIPQGTVKRRLYQARKILRKMMEEAGYDR